MKLFHIVASSQNGVIGLKGELPWSLPEDLKFFKEKTENHILIMGRKTFDSINHPLPKRLSIVVTRKKIKSENKNVIYVESLKKAIEKAKTYFNDYPETVFIIGGGEIFKQSIDQVSKIYLTLIEKNIEGDTFYPLEDLKNFKKISEEKRSSPLSFKFLTYIKD